MPNSNEISNAFKRATKHIHGQQSFTQGMMQDEPVKALLNATYNSLKTAVNSGVVQGGTVTNSVLAKLQTDVFVFSGCKTYVQLKEAAALLATPSGIKPYAQFERDVQAIDATYNKRHLATEYQYAATTAANAARWQKYEAQKERYHLRYLTDNGPNVRPAHRALEGTVLPVDDPFWNQYLPKNGWNCHCFVVQVRIGEYPVADSEAAQKLGETATTQLTKDGKNAAAMFRYNAGKQAIIFPPKHPYATATPATVLANLKELAQKQNSQWVQDYKRTIYNLPVAQQYAALYMPDGQGRVMQHLLVNEAAPDYNHVMEVAQAFARKGQQTYILPQIHAAEKEARAKLLRGIASASNPDLRVGESYMDVKSPKKKDKAVTRIIEADRQLSIPVITDINCAYTQSDAQYFTKRAFNDQQFSGQKVYWLLNQKLVEIKKR